METLEQRKSLRSIIENGLNRAPAPNEPERTLEDIRKSARTMAALFDRTETASIIIGEANKIERMTDGKALAADFERMEPFIERGDYGSAAYALEFGSMLDDVAHRNRTAQRFTLDPDGMTLIGGHDTFVREVMDRGERTGLAVYERASADGKRHQAGIVRLDQDGQITEWVQRDGMVPIRDHDGASRMGYSGAEMVPTYTQATIGAFRQRDADCRHLELTLERDSKRVEELTQELGIKSEPQALGIGY